MQLAVKPKIQPRTLRVFIVEDATNVLTTLKDLVQAVGNAQVVAAVRTETEATAWAMANPSGWDLAIVDILLDQGDGFNVIRRLKQGPTPGQVVVFSAFVTDVIRRHCSTLGADAVFHKAESAQLAAYVDSLAHGRKPGPGRP